MDQHDFEAGQIKLLTNRGCIYLVERRKHPGNEFLTINIPLCLQVNFTGSRLGFLEIVAYLGRYLQS